MGDGEGPLAANGTAEPDIHVDSNDMAVLRTLKTAMLAAVLAAASAALAFADPPPGHHGHAQGRAQADGVIAGTVVAVNYGMASIVVKTARGSVPVAVTPTTSVFRGSGFASFADLGKGMHVTVDVSRSEGHLVAQIIRIK